MRIVFQPMGRRISVEKDTNILEAARLAGVNIRNICGGEGDCGKCKVIIQRGRTKILREPTEELLTEEEISEGYVLACLVSCVEDCEILVPPESRIEGQRILSEAKLLRVELLPAIEKMYLDPRQLHAKTEEQIRRILQFSRATVIPKDVEEKLAKGSDFLEGGATLTVRRNGDERGILDVEAGDTSKRNYGLAIDVGTTKIAAYLVNLATGEVVDVESDYNRQLMYGEDLISRVVNALDGKGLQKAVADTINGITGSLALKNQIEVDNINDICVAGNTVMTYLLARKDPSPLLEPGASISRDPIEMEAKSLGLNANPSANVYCLPCVSRFLGGDAIGDILLSRMYESSDISIMIDIGTNVEVVLGSKDWFLSTTAAAGPAFEGWGIEHGIRSVEGAIDHLEIDANTLRAEYTVIGGIKPRGLCGSALIDALSEMFRKGIVDSIGKINTSLDSPYVRKGRGGGEYVVVPAEETGIGRDIIITEKDVANLLDSKAAACAATSVLLKKMKLSVGEINNVYICGAFGRYMDPGSAITIGLIPEFTSAEITYLGNGSVAGAYLTLSSLREREMAGKIANLTTYFDLLIDPDFVDEYSAALYLPGKKELFPTWWEVSRRIKRK